jgi:uncharacterized protein (DUF302 family)
MAYYVNRKIGAGFDDAVERATQALKEEGFGILTDIDVGATLKKKLDVDFRNYRILEACNPPNAYNALQAEDKIGTMLPCNVILQETSDGEVELAAIDPWPPCRRSRIRTCRKSPQPFGTNLPALSRRRDRPGGWGGRQHLSRNGDCLGFHFNTDRYGRCP